jgi:DNA primase
VAVPLAWNELIEHTETPVWTVRTVAERLSQPDPWADIGEARQALTRAARGAVER